MANIIFDLSEIGEWYWLVIIGLTFFGLLISVITKNAMPILYNGTVAVILLLFSSYLEPMLFGWQNSSNDIVVYWVSLTVFFIWFFLIFQIQYNYAIHKKAVA